MYPTFVFTSLGSVIPGHYIAEALAKLKEWNPTWKPYFFMTILRQNIEQLSKNSHNAQCISVILTGNRHGNVG